MNEKTGTEADVNAALLQSQENARRIGALEQTFQSAIEKLFNKMDNLEARFANQLKDVEKNHQPNFGVMASWAGVVLVLVSLVGGGMFYYINKRFDTGDVNRVENFNQLDRRITRLEDNEDREREADLQRLKDWQMEQLKK